MGTTKTASTSRNSAGANRIRTPPVFGSTGIPSCRRHTGRGSPRDSRLRERWSQVGPAVYNIGAVLRGFFLAAALLVAGAVSVPCLEAAEFEGKWKVVWDTEGGTRTSEWSITREGDSIKVEMHGQVFEGTVADNRIVFEGRYHASEAGYSSTIKVEGTLDGGVITGRGTWAEYGMTFVARRPD